MLWGQNDQSVTANSTTTKETSKGAPIGVWNKTRGPLNTPMDSNSHFGNTSPGSRANVDVNLYGNTTMGAFIPNIATGVFAVNAAMLGTTGGGIELGRVVNSGSGYSANAAVTLTVVSGGSGATANATVVNGHVTALNANQAGTGYMAEPTVTIAAPTALNVSANNTSFEPTGSNSNFSANTNGVTTNTFIVIATANTTFLPNAKVLYTVPAGNTALSPLVGNTYYWVAFSNTTVVSLAQSLASAQANTPVNTLNPGATAMTGELALAYDVILLSTANSLFVPGDQLYYGVPTGNTAVPPLSPNTWYYVVFSNTTSLAISATSGGPNIAFTPSFTGTQTHTLTGVTATGVFDVSSAVPQVTSAGWVFRTEGSGGRAGRVQYETLVAMHSIGVNGTTSTGVYGAASTSTSNATVDAII